MCTSSSLLETTENVLLCISLEMGDGEGITDFMKKLFDDYKNLRGKKKDSGGRPFWDLVVITTADTAQQEAFQLQIDEKFRRSELPVDLTIIVVPDPPGVRIGNGGSTLTALEYLENVHGSKIYDKKILLIHAGGWSQRMPSATILGKIFSVLPHGSPPYQMLDLKLALYWPFVDKIEPGVFLVCADDFLVYSFVSSKDWKIPAKGFTALAHPSSVEVGKTHGVYVMKNIPEINLNNPVVMNKCLEVLQKPSYERMKSQGALLKGENHEFADGICIEGEVVYTDSSFYFGTDIMEKLLNFKKSVGNLSCEIDAYGDFLQAVGENATNGYIHLTSNVSQMTPNLLEMRQGVFDCLNGSDIHALILNASVFIHIGTTNELLYHFCQNKVFQNQLAFEKDVFNAWKLFSSILGNEDPSQFISEKVERSHEKVSPTACIIHSSINNESTVNDNCVLDYCDFELPVNIQQKCIISNCELNCKETKTSQHARIVIPERTFFHTVPITVKNTTQYVTIFFSIDDNLKRSVAAEDVESLPFMDSDIRHFIKTHGLVREDILPENFKNKEVNLFDSLGGNNSQVGKTDKVSLWNLKLYPAKTSMTTSFEEAIHAVSLKSVDKSQKMSVILFSLADLVMLKDVKAMLNFRKNLFEKIS